MFNKATPVPPCLSTATNGENDPGSSKEREEWEMIDDHTIEKGVEDEWLHLTHHTTCAVSGDLVDDGDDEDGFEVVTTNALPAAAAPAPDVVATVCHRYGSELTPSTPEVHTIVAKDEDEDKDKVQDKAEDSGKSEDNGKDCASDRKKKIIQRLLELPSCPQHAQERRELMRQLVRERERERPKRPRQPPQLQLSKTKYLRAIFSDKYPDRDKDKAKDAEIRDAFALFDPAPASASASAPPSVIATDLIPPLTLDERAWAAARWG